jgi:hypothetical protein
MAGEQKHSAVVRGDHGWIGGCLDDHRWEFRRHTLLVLNGVSIVVSTTSRWNISESEYEEIAPGRHFETRAFHSQRYWIADETREVQVTSKQFGSDFDGDNIANEQHEAVVEEISKKMELGEFNGK